MIERKILLNPGPATTTDSVKMAQVVSDICPREKDFCEVMKSIRKDLVKIVNGDDNYTSVLFGGSGTAVMDVVMNSVVAPDKKVLIIINGSYGDRLKEICDVYKIDTVILKFKPGEEISLKKVNDLIKRERVNYVAATHHETTTGIINPIQEIGKICKENNCVFIVDTISSFAGIPIDIKTSNIDFMISTSNKCIQGLPGCAFVICKKSELEKTKSFRRSFYLHLWSQYDYLEKTGQMPFTPPVQTIYALKQAIKEYFEEGSQKRFERYKKSHETLVKGLNELGFKTTGGIILTTVHEPENFDFNRVHDELYKKGITVYPGKTGEKTFRIANMGAIDYRDIEKFLITLKGILKK